MTVQKGQKKDCFKKFNILFVCTGNICRSPMAEGIFKKILPFEYSNKVKIFSAGLGGLEKYPASNLAIEVAKENWVDISSHVSQCVSIQLLEKSNIVFIMARDHGRLMRFHFSNFLDKVFFLKNFDREKKLFQRVNIADPIGKNKEFYRKIYREIEEEIKRILPKILQMVDDHYTKYQLNSASNEEESEKDCD